MEFILDEFLQWTFRAFGYFEWEVWTEVNTDSFAVICLGGKKKKRVLCFHGEIGGVDEMGKVVKFQPVLSRVKMADAEYTVPSLSWLITWAQTYMYDYLSELIFSHGIDPFISWIL